ncbi:MAG: transcriptional regulator, TetR family [Caulobacteraceae bacterium]|nr:transcriptional regulator, TetR family [Caulobacteraceae bacterium]
MNVVIAKPQRDDKREAILSIARQVFMEEGYAAASMSTIATRLGGSKGTLYNYFRSKAELFVAVIQHQCDLSQEELFDVPHPDLRTYLTQLAGRFARLMLSEDVLTMHRIVVAEAVRFPEIGRALYEAGPKRGKARMIAYFEQAIAEGRLKRCDCGRAAEQAMELTLAGLYRRRLWNVGPPPTEAEIDANVQAGVETFMAAFGV